MLHKLNKRKDEGFTIIEVLIVLAIAGLILLVVFMAVPALQRNSRNTQRKNDASSVIGAVTEYLNNHAGVLPTTDGQFDAAFPGAVPNFGFYKDATKVRWDYNATAIATAVPAGTDSITVANNATCKPDASGAQVANATIRSLVVLFNVEGSSGAVPQCVQS